MKIGLVYESKEVNNGDLKNIEKIFNQLKIEYKFFQDDEVENIGGKLDFIITIGGDNIVLKTLLQLSQSETPILSLCGRRSKGFLYTATIDLLPELLYKIIRGNYILEKRIRLAIKMGDKKLPSVLNDAVIISRTSGKLIRYTLYINNEYIWRDDADGVIVSTPTGSTAYALSAGGAIIRDADAVEIVPINTLIPTHKPIITSSNNRILITDLAPGEETLILDGQIRISIDTDSIEIRRSKYKANFIKFRDSMDYSIDKRLVNRILPKSRAKSIKKLPPSAKLIYKLLEYEGPLTYRELLIKSGLPPRTIRYALKKLIENGIIVRSPLDRDARRMIYMLRE